MAVAACGGAAAPAAIANIAVVETPPAIRFAVLDADASRLRVMAVEPRKSRLVVERELRIGETYDLAWVAPSTLAATHFTDTQPIIELVDALDERSELPDIAWPPIDKGGSDDVAGSDLRAFTSGHQQTLAVAHCAWKQPDGSEARGPCTRWQYARVMPPPITVLDAAPAEDPALYPIPAVEPRAVTASVGADNQPTCTDARGRHDLVPPEAGAYAVTWLVADPPMFRFDTTSGSGFGPGYTTHQIYEGCSKSKRFLNAFAGPHGELVLAGDQVEVYWHGRLVARDPGHVDSDGRDPNDDAPLAQPIVVFAPPAP